jgi:ubiquinone/menaquinone biosynthesis C-methylase UbiE
MKKVLSHAEALSEFFSFPGTTAVDVGCGTGDFTRWMAAQGVAATGLDVAEMIARAEAFPRAGGERYLVGIAQELPVDSGVADLAVYMASLHHVPESEMSRALEECRRILKPGGTAIFVEPVAETGSYYEIVRLVVDERDIQAKAFEAIKAAGRLGLGMTAEGNYYLERSFEDYLSTLEVNVGDAAKRAEIAALARAVTERLSRAAGLSVHSYRYRSICRVNILKKSGSPQ